MNDFDTAHAFRMDLGPRIDAIDAALSGLPTGDADAERTLRALARSICEQASTLELEPLRDCAEQLEHAPAPRLKDLALRMLALLREAAALQRPDPAVLIVGGDSACFDQVAAALASLQHPVVHAPSGADAQRMLRERPVVCVVLNVVLPDVDGRTLLTQLRENSTTASIPVLLLAERIDETLREDSQMHAADAHLEQPRDIAAIAEWVQSRLRRAPETAKSARRDLLTGLLNRAAFRESFERIAQESAQAREPLAIATISVDSSRAVLSGLDAEAREDILQSFGLLLSKSLRATDVVARWGLYEFTALFPGEDHAGGLRAIEKVIEKLQGQTFSAGGGAPISIAISAGVAVVAVGESLDDAMTETERYVYQASSRGGNLVMSGEAHTPAVRRPRALLLVRDAVTTHVLQQLLEKDHFQVAALDHWDPDATEEIAKQRQHLVVIDETLPPSGGLEALQALRGNRRISRTPIIMLVASGSEAIVTRALELGANDYIVRPFSPSAFIGRTHRLLARGTRAAIGALFRILVISDDAKALVLVGSSLHQRGRFDVLLAKGGRQGLERIDSDPPDAVIVDLPIQVPAGSPPFLQALAEKTPHGIGIVLAEAPPAKGQPQSTYPAPIRGRLVKPFNPLKTGTEVEALLGIKSAGRRKPAAKSDQLSDEIRRIMSKDA